MSRKDSALKAQKQKLPGFLSCMKTLSEDMNNLLISGDHSDLVIECQDHRFKVHRAIVSLRCKFFRACLSSGFKEGQEGIIKLDEDDPAALWIVLNEIYTRNPSSVKLFFLSNEDATLHLLITIWTLADKYGLPNLAQQCVVFVESEEGINLLKDRSGATWIGDIIIALQSTVDLNVADGKLQQDTSIRRVLKAIIACPHLISGMTPSDEELLKSSPELAVEVLKLVVNTMPGVEKTAASVWSCSVFPDIVLDAENYVGPCWQ